MRSLDGIKQALLSVTDRVSHYFAWKQEPPYLVWAEDGQGTALWADGKMELQTITGTIDLFTKNLRGEPLFEATQQALDQAGISWRLNSVQYEEDTRLLHYEWRWEIGPDSI